MHLPPLHKLAPVSGAAGAKGESLVPLNEQGERDWCYRITWIKPAGKKQDESWVVVLHAHTREGAAVFNMGAYTAVNGVMEDEEVEYRSPEYQDASKIVEAIENDQDDKFAIAVMTVVQLWLTDIRATEALRSAWKPPGDYESTLAWGLKTEPRIFYKELEDRAEWEAVLERAQAKAQKMRARGARAGACARRAGALAGEELAEEEELADGFGQEFGGARLRAGLDSRVRTR
jgi:hypothetical protein